MIPFCLFFCSFFLTLLWMIFFVQLLPSDLHIKTLLIILCCQDIPYLQKNVLFCTMEVVAWCCVTDLGHWAGSPTLRLYSEGNDKFFAALWKYYFILYVFIKWKRGMLQPAIIYALRLTFPISRVIQRSSAFLQKEVRLTKKEVLMWMVWPTKLLLKYRQPKTVKNRKTEM